MGWKWAGATGAVGRMGSVNVVASRRWPVALGILGLMGGDAGNVSWFAWVQASRTY